MLILALVRLPTGVRVNMVESITATDHRTTIHCRAKCKKDDSLRASPYFLSSSLVYRIDDTIRIVDTLIRYTIRIAIRIVSFIQ